MIHKSLDLYFGVKMGFDVVYLSSNCEDCLKCKNTIHNSVGFTLSEGKLCNWRRNCYYGVLSWSWLYENKSLGLLSQRTWFIQTCWCYVCELNEIMFEKVMFKSSLVLLTFEIYPMYAIYEIPDNKYCGWKKTAYSMPSKYG